MNAVLNIWLLHSAVSVDLRGQLLADDALELDP